MRHIIAAIIVALVLVKTVSGQVYNIVPIDLGDGYSIATGSTMTALDGEVTDWLITISGEHPFTFRPPSDFVSFENLIVSEDDISITLAGSDAGAAVLDRYRGAEGCIAEDFCEATLAWSRGFNPVTNQSAQEVSFNHRAVTQAAGSNPDGPDADDYVFNVFTSQPLPLGTTVIAVASQHVPEPTTGSLFAMGLLCLTGLRRKRSQ